MHPALTRSRTEWWHHVTGRGRELSLVDPAQHQRRVYSAEAEGVREDVLHSLCPARSRQKVKITGCVRNLKVDRRWKPFALECKSADRCLDRSRRSERVTVVALGPADGHAVGALSHHRLDGHRLGRVVERSRAAVRIHVSNFSRGNFGIGKGET